MWGWFSLILFGLSGIVPVIEAIHDGFTPIPWSLLIVWLLGEICAILHVWPRRDWPLLLNYFVNLGCLIILIYYKVS